MTRSSVNSCSGISSFSLSLISQFQESGSWVFWGEEWVENCLGELAVLLWSEGLELHHPVLVVGCIIGGRWCQGCCSWCWFGNWLLTMGLHLFSFVGLILGVPAGIRDGGWGVGCCASPSSLFDIVEIVASISKSGYWVCLCWSNFSGQDSNTSQ